MLPHACALHGARRLPCAGCDAAGMTDRQREIHNAAEAVLWQLAIPRERRVHDPGDEDRS
jgi:hypothetical protein